MRYEFIQKSEERKEGQEGEGWLEGGRGEGCETGLAWGRGYKVQTEKRRRRKRWREGVKRERF